MTAAAFQIVRLVLVLALVCVAAALATPKGRLPLALRGVMKVLRNDNTVPSPLSATGADKVPLWKRLLAFVLILLAIVLSLL